MPSPKDFTVHKAQLLNILNLKSSSAERNFHGYKVPSEYTENDSSALCLVTHSLQSKINMSQILLDAVSVRALQILTASISKCLHYKIECLQ
jgi:hypothetical protein